MSHSQANTSIAEFQYSRTMGQHRPNFEGKPEDYYELNWREITCAVTGCLLILCIMIGLAIGFFVWTDNAGTSSFALVWSIILLIFLPFFVLLSYLASRNKHQIEANMIKRAVEAEQAKIQGSKRQQLEMNE